MPPTSCGPAASWPIPTETAYGLAVDAGSDEAAARLFEAKGRDPALAVALVAADIAQAEQVGTFGEPERTADGGVLAGAADDCRGGVGGGLRERCARRMDRSVCACRRIRLRADWPACSAAA